MGQSVFIVEKEELKVMVCEAVREAIQKEPPKWVTHKTACGILGFSEKSSTLWLLRSKGLLTFSNPTKKHIMYSRESLLQYLENHKKEAFK